MARIYLQSGLLDSAQIHISAVEADPEADLSLKTMNAVLLAVAKGDWKSAGEKARMLAESEPGDVVVSLVILNRFF